MDAVAPGLDAELCGSSRRALERRAARLDVGRDGALPGSSSADGRPCACDLRALNGCGERDDPAGDRRLSAPARPVTTHSPGRDASIHATTR